MTATRVADPVRIRSQFGFGSTADEVVEGLDLSGKRALVTGASSGIGRETARALAGAGAKVTLAVRDLNAGARVAEEITERTGNPRIDVAGVELADLHSVQELAADWSGPLHILINNAGVMATPEVRTQEGWELQFATNHLGHFQLAVGLLDAMKEAEGARVVVLSSVAHVHAAIDFDDLNFKTRDYDPWLAYGASKTANSLFAVEATRRWGRYGVFANALMPGGIATNLGQHVTKDDLRALRQVSGGKIEMKTLEQGAATSVFVATSPLLDRIGGRYFEDCNEAERWDRGRWRGVADHALDPGAARRLWDVSSAMAGEAVI
jgi:NAD(P)-dependent dehydrogenase (short-subunit alcohol dehydrogenase family)